MAEAGVTGPVRPMVLGRLQILLSILFDSILLAIWYSLVWVFDWVTSRVPGEGHLDWNVARYIFSGATLVLIVIFLYWDLRSANVIFRNDYESLKNDARSVRVQEIVEVGKSSESSHSVATHPKEGRV